MNHTLYVLDATALLFRSYYGQAKSQAGQPAPWGAVRGVCVALSHFLRRLDARHVVLVFDAKEKTFRHELFPEYKSNRKAPPPELEKQFDLSFEASLELGFCCLREPGYEADDLMATLAARSQKAGIDVVLVTPDKDVLQLVGDGIWTMDPKSLERQDPLYVVDRLGVPPHHVCDLLALAGDASDNVPGVPGIGLKTAQAIIQNLGSLDDIYADLKALQGLEIRGAKSLPKKMAQGRELAFLSRDLVVLKDDVPLSRKLGSLGAMRYQGPKDSAREFFEALGFRPNLLS